MPRLLNGAIGDSAVAGPARVHLARMGIDMLLALAAVLLVLWALGFFAIHLGAFIHIVIVLAVIAVILHFVRGRRTRV